MAICFELHVACRFRSTWRLCIGVLGVVLFAQHGTRPISADELSAKVAGTEISIEMVTQGDTQLLDLEQTGKAFGWQTKIQTPGKLAILCQEGPAGVCIPLRLDQMKSATVKNRLYVEVAALSRALHFELRTAENIASLHRQANPVGEEGEVNEVAAYNAAWGPNRGFSVGQTVPDIPLFDMQGSEVRLSNYLGKRYILYCWASW